MTSYYTLRAVDKTTQRIVRQSRKPIPTIAEARNIQRQTSDRARARIEILRHSVEVVK